MSQLEYQEIELFRTQASLEIYGNAYWKVKYLATYLEPGKTRVKWELYKGGRNNTGTLLATTLIFYINDETVYAPPRFSTAPNADGTNHPHCSYKDALNKTPTASGEFDVQHGSDGSGSFTMKIEAAIYSQTMRSGGEVTINLDNNLPQTPCYWESESSVSVDRTYIAPGRDFTISWSGAKNGVGNNIQNFRVWYKVGDNIEIVKSVGATNNSATFQLECGQEERGKNLLVGVDIIDNMNHDKPIQKTNASSIINPSLGNLIINSYSGQKTGNIFKHGLDEVEFSFFAPKKNTEQKVRIMCAIESEEFTVAPLFEYSTKDWQKGAEKTFTFWASDGEEISAKQTITLTRNEDRASSAKLDYNNCIFTISLPTDCQGSLELYENNVLQKTISVISGDKKDIRTLLEKSWVSGETYTNLIGKLICVYRIDEAIIQSPSLTISVPEITVEGKDGYYLDGIVDTIQVTINDDSGAWEFSKELEQIGQGRKLDRIKMKGNFYVTPLQTVTTIKDLALDFSIQDNRYKPYSQSLIFTSSFDGQDWGKYGLSEMPQLTFWFDESYKIGPITNGTFSNDGTVSYTINGPDGYIMSQVFSTGDKPYLSYSYENSYKRTVIQTASVPIELDFREQARRSNEGESWYICAIPSGENWNSNYAIQNWNCIKESMILNTNFEIAATTVPKVQIERSVDKKTWTKFCEFNPTQNGTNNDLFNTEVPIYTLDSATIGEITQGSEDYIRLVIQTDEMTPLIKQYSENTFEFAQHIEPLIKFTSVSYIASVENPEEGSISADYIISLLGSNLETKNSFYCYIKEKKELIQGEVSNQELQELTFHYKMRDTFINIAPVLSTSLGAILSSADLTFDGQQSFFTEKTTSSVDYEFLICYNISPTIAYRPNFLGINTGAPTGEKVLLDINSYNNQEIIYFRHSTGTASINLATMGMSGFIFDCGSWDNTPGGIIPGGGSAPEGLAQVAYTGNIADLVQTPGTEIIIGDID